MTKSRILVVDDDPKLSHLIATILTRIGGYEVCEENRAFAVMSTARHYHPDVILLDVDMPGKDGGAVARELGEDPVLAGIPMVFVTSLISANEAGMRYGARYLAKPLNPQLLLDTVRSLCPRFKRAPKAA